MIELQRVPTHTLDVKTGEVRDPAGILVQPEQKPADIGIDTQDFHQQVQALAKSGVPLEKALKTIDSHDGITDKASAKSMAAAVYEIVKPAKM